MTSQRGKRQGASLLITIGVLASLVAILVAATASEQVALRGIGNRMAARRAKLMAEAGIQQALATLSTQSSTATSQQDAWYQLGQTGATRYVVGDDSFRIQIVDASALVNLNTAPEAQLDKLPLTQEQIDSLLDWRAAGETARADGGKDQYYNSLTNPYNAKLGALNTVDELTLIKGFTPKSIYEPQTDTFSTTPLPAKPDGTSYTLYDLSTVDSISSNGGGGGAAGGAGGGGGLPNLRNVTRQQLVQRGIPDNPAGRGVASTIFQRRAQLTTWNAVLSLPGVNPYAKTLVDNFTVGTGATATGKIDANTASEAVLETVPGITPDIANAIITYQGTGFTKLGDLFNVSGYSAVARQSLDLLSTNTQTFIVHTIGTAGSVKVSLDAVVQVSSTGARILKITQPPYADMVKQWGWDDQTTTDNVLLEASPQ